MPELGVAWATDIAILELSGSSVEDRGDHLILRSPLNPRHHWGNCILVTDSGAVDDAERWVGVFEAAFPAADWIAIGLTRMPADAGSWQEKGVELEPLEVLSTSSAPRQAMLPEGYEVRRLAGDDWDRTVQLSVEENEATRGTEAASYEGFARTRAEVTRALCEHRGDLAAYFGAFAGDVLAAHLGVVCCGATGRYQSVLTRAPHRRRGLGSHLVGVAARWAAARGCDRWVIVTEATNPAGRVYRALGFEPSSTYVQAHRSSARSRARW
jgi:GNAT superfamily N-acetyltransferase